MSSVRRLVPTDTSTPSVAIFHDRFPGIGGGEAFALEAARVLDAPVYTTYVAEGTELPEDVTVHRIVQEKYTRGLSGRLLEWRNEGSNPLETLAVALDATTATPHLREYDVVLASAPLSKQYVPEADQTVLHYPHSPPRWLYDLYTNRLSSLPGVAQPPFALYAALWRTVDKAANSHVDRFLANSEVVRDRIRRHYARDADVIYPPVTGDWRDEGDDGYFVTWSRLDPDKRVPLIAEAFAGLDERLVVMGDGPDREAVERVAATADGVEVRGYVDDVESVVARATAVVYAPRQEDFGLVGAEALSAGKPLLGVDEGFTRHQVDPGKTGLLFEPTVESLRETVRSFDPDAFDADEIVASAAPYQRSAFATRLREAVQAAADREWSADDDATV